MPISQFIKGEIGTAEINRLTAAYAKALRMLDLVDRNDPVAEIVAKKVVEVGTSDVVDPQEIADAVVEHFRRKCPL